MRNKGPSQYRFKDNPLEEEFAKAWEKENTRPIGGKNILEYIAGGPNGVVSERNRVVAATVIQWLRSPVGQSFIRDMMKLK